MQAQSVSLGIGRLKMDGGRASFTAGFDFDDQGLRDFSLLIQAFQGATAATQFSIEIDTKRAYLADPLKQGDKIIGYKRNQPRQPLILGLPLAGAVEITIRRTPDGVLSALKLHGPAAGAALATQGIFKLSLGDKVLVVPDVFEIGLSLTDLFLDLSDSAATPVSGLFSEVYEPGWTGVGAKSISLHLPIDDAEDEWINAGLEGFLLGFDGRLSAKGTLAYAAPDTEGYVRGLSGEIDIRNGDVVRGAVSLDLNLEKSAASLGESGTATAPGGLSASQQTILDRARTDTANATSQPGFSFSGDVKCRAQLIQVPIDPDHSIWGCDITAEAIEAPNSPAGLSLTGTPAQAMMWLGLGAGAVALLVQGKEEEDAAKLAGGLGLLFLAIADLGDTLTSGPGFLPRLQRLDIRKLGYRFVRFPAEGATPKKSVHQILLDVSVSVLFKGVLVDLISAIAGRGLDVATSFAKLFAKTVTEIEVKGPLELGFDNLAIAFEVTESGTEIVSKLDERVRRVAGQQDLRITARKLPVIELKPAPAGGGSKIPKPVMGVEFVKNDAAGETRFGVALQIRGIEHPDFAASTPVIGIVIYIVPEFGIDFEASLMVEPKFRFVIPYWVLVEGAFEINKPVPGFDAVQTRISVDVGVISTDVPRNTTIQKDQMQLLHDLSKYKYRFGGKVAWGEALKNDPARRFDFLFAEAHYEAATALIPIGPVGIYGLGGLFGRNIAPGIGGDTRDASAIATWIEGNGQQLDSVLDWPSMPTHSTWHPERDHAGDDDLIVAGLKVVAGPLSGRELVDVEGLLVVGFDQFWLAAAGLVRVKSVNLQALAVVVYDDPSRSFAIRVRFEFKIETGGGTEIVGVSGPFEISSGSEGVRIFLGHYLEGRGGPLVARLLEDLFRAKYFYVYESEGQPVFGFALPGMDERPSLGRHAYGQGVLFEYGPKKIGPSAIHVRIHAGAGYNFGLSVDPFLLFGEVFASGSLHVKVLFVKLGFTLSAYLAGRLTSARFDFRGRLSFKVGMPWPIPDIDVSFGFGFTLGGGADIPMPAVASTAFALLASESRSEEFVPDQVPVVRIDQVIGLRVGKPLAGIMAGTSALLDIEPLPADPAVTRERVETRLAGETFTIEYEYYLRDLRITHRPVGGGAEVVVNDIFTSWEVPPAFQDIDGAPDPAAVPRHALYFNTLLQPGLKFFPETLGKVIRGRLVTGYLPPCERPPRACLIAGSAPDMDEAPESGLRTASRTTPYGAIRVRETRLPGPPSPLFLQNQARLAWAGNALRLPEEVRVEVPAARHVTMTLQLDTAVSRLVGSVEITLDVFLAGHAGPARLLISLTPGQTPCGLALNTDTFPPSGTGIVMDAAVRDCTQHGTVVLGIDITAASNEVVLSRLRLRGPQIVPPGTGRDGEGAPDPERWLKMVVELGQRLKLLLLELCFDTVEQGASAWDTSTLITGGDNTPEKAIDALLGNLLLEPNRIYTISYGVETRGSTVTDADTDEPLDASASQTTASSFGGALRTVSYRTEAEPSQEIARYMGFVFPAAQMAPVYPDHCVPVVSFRNMGLIKRIFRAHRGADVLAARLRDIDGAEIATVKTSAISLASSAADELQEELVAACLPQAQGFTRIQIDIFDRALQPDTRYALSVEDTSLTTPAVPPPFRSAFRTSRHTRFADHVAAANMLLADPVQIPLLDPDPATGLASVFAAAAAGDISGHDALVEALYRRGLGHEPGRLAAEYGPGGDVAAHFVRSMPDGSLAAFGIALELGEPLLGKEGVTLAGAPGALPPALEDKGIAVRTVAGISLLTVRDRSGTRLLVFRSADGATFQPFLAPATLPVAFDGAGALRAAVAAYVDDNFAALDAATRAQRINATMTELAAEPLLATGFIQLTGALALKPVEGA
jgi:hypothetical protein